MRKITAIGIVSILFALLIGLAAPVSASGGGGGGSRVVVRTNGNCSGATDWKLKAKSRDGGLEVEFEVDSNRNGQVWNVRLVQNGATVMSGARTTHAPSGSFSVERALADAAGTDTIVATASNARTGESCRGSLSI